MDLILFQLVIFILLFLKLFVHGKNNELKVFFYPFSDLYPRNINITENMAKYIPICGIIQVPQCTNAFSSEKKEIYINPLEIGYEKSIILIIINNKYN